MPMWVKVLIGVVIAIAVILIGIFSLTSGLTKTANGFFAAARKGDIGQAYQYTSADFQASTSSDALAAFLKANALDQVTGTSWSSRAVNGRTGKLEGSLTIATGGVIPIKIDLTKGSDGWKILAIRKAAAGLQSGEVTRQLPSERDQVALVGWSIREFTDAVANGSMAEFHRHIAVMWAKQASVEDLDRSYGALYANGSAFQVLQTMAPVFDEAAHISDQGILTLAGHYTTTPERMNFVLKYIFEGTEWKLFGLSVKTESVAAE